MSKLNSKLCIIASIYLEISLILRHIAYLILLSLILDISMIYTQAILYSSSSKSLGQAIWLRDSVSTS